MQLTVLVVDDDEDSRTIYASALRARGYRVLVAGNGAEGVHAARREVPDLILLDLLTPIMDGWTAGHYLKTFRATTGIPICAMSAQLLTDEERGRFDQIGFECFLEKPITPSRIVAEVEERIGGPGPDPYPRSPETGPELPDLRLGRRPFWS